MPKLLIVNPVHGEVEPVPNIVAILLFFAGSVLAVIAMALKAA